MTVTEILQLADELVFAKKGKHLDELQESIIKGVWENQTYQEIADECNRSESRVRNVASQLLKLLSEELGENIGKDNFRSTFKRLTISLSPLSQNICLNFGSQILYNSDQNNPKKHTNHNQSQLVYHDLTFAPQILKFCNRENELQTLSNWVVNHNTRLISVLGLSGMGKSYLVKRFIDLNLEQFEVIIWKSLKYPDSLDLLIDDLLKITKKEIKPNTNNKLKQLFEMFIEKRCLIILDDVENLFMNGQFAGQYKPEYQDYQSFFTKIIETNHQSHVILISQERCKEMECLDEELYPVKYLELSGLEGCEIFGNMGLKDEENWLSLINLYEGNPFYLITIARSIKNVFDGYVREFLAENELIITKDMQANFQGLFNRLSSIEQKIIIQLSQAKQHLSREDLKSRLELSSTDLINGLESLQQRYLVTKMTEDKILFQLSPIFREYARDWSKDWKRD